MKQNHKSFLAQQFLLFIILAGTTIDSWSAEILSRPLNINLEGRYAGGDDESTGEPEGATCSNHHCNELNRTNQIGKGDVLMKRVYFAVFVTLAYATFAIQTVK
jgi:hypothetical protein